MRRAEIHCGPVEAPLADVGRIQPSTSRHRRHVLISGLRFLAWPVFAWALATGCSGSHEHKESPAYMPGWPEARSAVETALTSWRDAGPTEPLATESQTVMFLDRQRRPGDRLRSFAILGQSDVENVRQFTVRLQIEGEPSPRLVRYNVLGRNPSWVFRLEDFERVCHWEHPMDEVPSNPRAQSEDVQSPAALQR
jgi:hypothetical protein